MNDLSERLTALLDGALHRRTLDARRLGRPVLLSATLPLEGVEAEPFSTFAAGRAWQGRGSFWARPAEELWAVGVGEALRIAGQGQGRFEEAWRQYGDLLADAVFEGADDREVAPLLLGGFGFDPIAGEDSEWAAFPDALLVLHRLLLQWSKGRTWATFNFIVSPQTDASAEIASAVRLLHTCLMGPGHAQYQRPQPNVVRLTEGPPGEWGDWVSQALDLIERRQITKAVLARQKVLEADAAFSQEAALRYLTKHYPQCATFAFSDGSACFLGATPEPLVRLKDGAVNLSCLAGTVARGKAEDERGLLLDDPKERLEHEAVVNMVVETLRDRCVDLSWNETPEVVRLRNVAHLRTTFTAQAADGTHVLDLVEALHPTPAVGGVPTGAAMALIRQLEGGRGWYAGPVGWVDHRGEGEFCVAIRSALLTGNTAVLFAGAGIVDGSVAARELQETESKFQPMLCALGVEGR